MPIPVSTRMIHADIRNPDGTPAAGSVEFIQRYWLYDETGDVVLAPGSYTGVLENGEATVEVPATDAAGVTPTGRTVTVRIIAASARAFYDIEVPSGAGGLELADLPPVASAGTPTTYATAAALAALDAEVAAHTADTTAVHGIADTGDLVLDGDARLTNSRTPTAHAASHGTAGADPVTPAAIGAAARDMNLAAWNDVAMVIDQADDTATEPDTGLWPDRVEYRYRGQRVQWANEFMEARCTPAHPANDGSGGSTVGWRMYAAPNDTAYAARSAAVPVWEVANYRSGASPNVPLLSLDHLGALTGTAPAWSALSLQAGTTAWNTAPATRLETLYKVVRCRGQILNGTAGTITAGTTLAVVAAEHRPPANLSTRLTRAAAVDDQRMFTINAATGALTSASGLGVGEAVVLDGLTWAL